MPVDTVRRSLAPAAPRRQGRATPTSASRRVAGLPAARRALRRCRYEQGRLGPGRDRRRAGRRRRAAAAASRTRRASRRSAFADRRRRDRHRRRARRSARPDDVATALSSLHSGPDGHASSACATARGAASSSSSARAPPAARTCGRDAGAAARARAPSSRARLRERVLPELGSHAGRAHARRGAGRRRHLRGRRDAEESWLERSLAERRRGWRSSPRTAAWSRRRTPTDVLVVDPIDGTRPAMAGLESACVSVALAPLGDGEPTMARRASRAASSRSRPATGSSRSGAPGVRADATGRAQRRQRDAATGCSGPTGSAGGPARPTVEVLAELIDGSSVGGGDVRARLAGVLTDARRHRPARRVRRGRLADRRRGARGCARSSSASATARVLNNSPYDLAAPWPVPERGAAASSPTRWAQPLGDRPLLGSGARVPDVVDLGRATRSCTPSSSDAGWRARHRARRGPAAAGARTATADRRHGRHAGYSSGPMLQPVAVARRALADYTHIVGRPARRGDPRLAPSRCRASASCTSRRPRSAAASRRSSTRWSR